MKHYLDHTDISVRYGCGTSVAYRIIRAIKAFHNGGKLPAGKVLLSEVEAWERATDKE